MRRLTAIAFLFFIVSLSPVGAADPGGVFGAILGEFGRQIERQQHKKQLNRLRPLWQACARGNVTACDRAASFPNLTNQARRQLWHMREAAVHRPAYERNFYACQKLDATACQAALNYRYASDIDRSKLRKWRRTANRKNSQVLAEFRLKERICLAGLLSACDEALALRHRDERAVPAIQRQRNRLIVAKQQRQRQEQRRIAAVRQYNALRDKCTAGERVACKSAVAHPQVPQDDIAFLNRRHRELAPITEGVVNFVSNVDIAPNNLPISTEGIIGAVFVLLVVIAGVIAIRSGALDSMNPARTLGDMPPAPDPKPDSEPHPHFTEQMFPLTGHMPTDVRRALYGTQH